MMQWHSCKKKCTDALLFFRLGDFYEAFYDDANQMAKELNLTLTARQGIPMCGVPFHTAESYIDKLLAKGYKVAIAEQVTVAGQTKGIMPREITRIVSPATVVSSELLSDKKNNFFASVVEQSRVFGLSWIDLTTGSFHTKTLENTSDLLNELSKIQPKEFLLDPAFQKTHPNLLKELSFSFPFLINEQPVLEIPKSLEILKAQIQEEHLERLKSNEHMATLLAASSLLFYLKEALCLSLDHIHSLESTSHIEHLRIDRTTMRHLELTESLHERSNRNTLLELLDETKTPMGGRLLVQWLQAPLFNQAMIEKRQILIGALLSKSPLFEETLSSIRDIERLMMKVASFMAGPKDLLSLGRSLHPLPKIKQLLEEMPEPLFKELSFQIFDSETLNRTILDALSENPPLRATEKGIFQTGFDPRLDHLRELTQNSVDWVSAYQQTLRQQTGIKTLKVGFTKAFGYYIEISKAQSMSAQNLPESFQRKQTLTNAERYITPELKEFEHQILSAEERAKALETELFLELRAKVAERSIEVQQAAKTLARLDVLCSLAKVAKEQRWSRPEFEEGALLKIVGGRHPIVERAIGRSSFVANDTSLSQEAQMMLITGPNMAGKSTYIRQVALIVILAQMGSFVPASSVRMSLVDQVFSRIGASDDVARGQSTFMVEMSETAHILNKATSKSLVLLDEIGRGTSTYDGISIAQAVAEYLLTTPNQQAKTLFATHYWELTSLSDTFSHIQNFQTAVQETSSGIVFLRKIVAGGTDKSYGIHVASLAGIPEKAILRAKERLKELEMTPTKPRLPTPSEPTQTSLLEEEIRDLNINALSPLEALQKLFTYQNQLKR